MYFLGQSSICLKTGSENRARVTQTTLVKLGWSHGGHVKSRRAATDTRRVGSCLEAPARCPKDVQIVVPLGVVTDTSTHPGPAAGNLGGMPVHVRQRPVQPQRCSPTLTPGENPRTSTGLSASAGLSEVTQPLATRRRHGGRTHRPGAPTRIVSGNATHRRGARVGPRGHDLQTRRTGRPALLGTLPRPSSSRRPSPTRWDCATWPTLRDQVP
jgi:hypothetical protein